MKDVLLTCNAGSECNSATLTFDGVDVMGERLAEEVRSWFSHSFNLLFYPNAMCYYEPTMIIGTFFKPIVNSFVNFDPQNVYKDHLILHGNL